MSNDMVLYPFVSHLYPFYTHSYSFLFLLKLSAVSNIALQGLLWGFHKVDDFFVVLWIAVIS